MILGSGFLSVKVSTDGPTRVLQISDVKNKVRRIVYLNMKIMFQYTNASFFSVNAHMVLSSHALEILKMVHLTFANLSGHGGLVR